MDESRLDPRLVGEAQSLRGSKLLLMVKLFPDGSGDFAFTSKLLDMLISNGCAPEDISLVLGVANCPNLLIEKFAAIYPESDRLESPV
jgi:hypothetical protein